MGLDGRVHVGGGHLVQVGGLAAAEGGLGRVGAGVEQDDFDAVLSQLQSEAVGDGLEGGLGGGVGDEAGHLEPSRIASHIYDSSLKKCAN